MRQTTALLCTTLLCARAFGAITNLVTFDFDAVGSPWASSGPVSFDTFTGAPVQEDGAAFIDGTIYASGTDFAGELNTGYGIQLWMRAPAVVGQGTEALIASFGNPETDGVSLYFVQDESNSYLTVRANGSGGGGVFAPQGGFDEWTHVALCYTNQINVYIDGELQGWTSAMVNPPTSDWYLFTSAETADRFSGHVDDVTFFTFAENGFIPEEDLAFFAVIPEPSTAAIMAGTAMLAVIGMRRRR
jgi:hypothetical protein